MPVRCDGEQSLVMLLNQLKVVRLLAMFYTYNTANKACDRACDMAIIFGSGRSR